MRPTLFVLHVIIINAIFFIAGRIWNTSDLFLWPTDSPNFHWYQYVTYMFCHASVFHLFLNALSLLAFGPMIEWLVGYRWMAYFYLSAGIAAGITFSLVSQIPGFHTLLPLVGNSGALYAIFVAFGIIFPTVRVVLLIAPIAVPSRYLAPLLFLFTIAVDTQGRVAHAAHFGGAIFGFIVFYILNKKRKSKVS